MTAGDGTVTIVSVTSEHPFHVQDWDGKVETMAAALNELSAIDAARIFPSDGKTPFGEWLKAGALKVGDQVSTRDTVEPSAANDNGQTIAGASGPRIATANDNQPLTIIDIVRENRANRVYNLEVESRPGEITHNYFVGDNSVWVHNAHGNSRKSPVKKFLYALYCNGTFMKWGMSADPLRRYTGAWLRRMGCESPVPIASGSHCDVRDREMELNRTRPGPWNRRI